MKKYQLYCFFLLFLCFISKIFSQQEPNILPDSLKNKSIEEIHGLSWKYEDSSLASFVIKKAKKDNNFFILTDAYYLMAYLHNDEKQLFYADSIIQLKDQFQNTIYPCRAYYVKGYYFFNAGDLQKATDNFTLAYNSAQKFNNQDIIYRSTHAFALLKEEIGDYEEAIEIHKQNLEYIDNAQDQIVSNKDHLRTLLAVTLSYNRLKKVDSSLYYIKKGIDKALTTGELDEYQNFVLASGQILFIDKQYKKSLDSLLKVKPFYNRVQDSTRLSITNFLMAKNYLEIDEDKKAINLLKSVDTIYQNHTDVRAKTKESYELLIAYYKRKNDFQNQLVYNEKLTELIYKIHNNEIYLNKKINNEYEIPRLIKNKQIIIDKLAKKNQGKDLKIKGLVYLAIAILIFTLYLNARRKLFKKRFEELMQKEEKSIAQINVLHKKQTLQNNIPDDVIKDILLNLDKFEENRGYLNSKLSMNKLAKDIGTNPNYLSKIINYYKKESFTQYVNNLRIKECVEQLKIADNIYQKYTIKGIAQEFGFNNTTSFSKAFYAVTGIKPSYFLKNLKNKEHYKSAS